MTVPFADWRGRHSELHRARRGGRLPLHVGSGWLAKATPADGTTETARHMPRIARA
jgi:hypothetical protein